MKKVNKITGKLAAVVIVAAFAVYFIFAMVDTGNAIHNSEALLDSYETAITEQEILEESIDREEEMQGTDEQIEKIAREELGLCKSNEKIYVSTSD